MIQQATLENLDELVELFDLYRIFYKKESNKEFAKTFLLDRLQNKESIVFIAYIGKEAVGFTQLYPLYSSARMEKNWILNDLYVKEEARKAGIGESLIKKAFSFAKENGAVFVQLSTAVDNYTAQSLYKKIGFELQEPDNKFLLFKKTV
ncbi:GNAT family N-acetyltransferase [Sphingobacterium sp. SRCM116780]|uniref:GNAT family N-acetyltransferase n=1 Tax=Sphingobacterium sp. SRCM116780 TaxID=2907623 RepID=UPI001F1FBE47|nr:GNAT family N-acetyltransferase [Sphingobacterium sp. SRCM116780]UIR55391.1 GNAT family N-acetyltransferase [Sphingobacterium sp. SRCM116780]